MKLIGTLLACCLIIAVVQASIAALFVACLLTLLWGAICQPVRTFSFVALSMLAAIATRYPGWSLGLLAIVAVTAICVPDRAAGVDSADDAI